MCAEQQHARNLDAEAVVVAVGPSVLRVVGSLSQPISHPAPLANADSGALTFCSARGEAAKRALTSCRASVVICSEPPPEADGPREGQTFIIVDNPRLAYIRAVTAIFSAMPPKGIHESAVIEPDATIGAETYIGPGAYVGKGVEIGTASVIHGRVYLYAGTRIGANVTIHAGTVIGADGFGYQRDADLTFVKFPHLGGVVIEDDVEIGANTCIDRGTLSDTIIRQGAKIDNLVHIAHNVIVGRHAAVIAHAMIAGSTRIGDYAWIAPCACVRDGLAVGERALIGLGAVVVKDVPAGETVMGAPARNEAAYKALLASLRELPAPRDG